MTENKTDKGIEKKMEEEQGNRVKGSPKIEAPKSTDQESNDSGTNTTESEQTVEMLEWEDYQDKVEYRCFDSNDIIQIRSGIMIPTEDLKSAKIDLGMMQKLNIVLGITSCPWFSDSINEKEGVTQTIYNRRMGLEFRRIPVEFIDCLFREASKKNTKANNLLGLKKKSN